MSDHVDVALLDQIRRLVGFVGGGRKLTQTGAVTLADARTLVGLLGTADTLDPAIGDRVFRTKSSTELGELSLLVAWAKAARLLRVTGGRLVAVKKNAALLDDDERLWLLLFDSFGRAGPAFLRTGWGESLLRGEFGDGLAEIFTCLHAGPIDRRDLQRRVWETVSGWYDLRAATALQLNTARSLNDGDMDRILDVLARLGAVTFDGARVDLSPQARRLLGRRAGDPEPGDGVLRLAVTLLDVTDPPVRRTLLVPAGYTLERLHEVLQAALGWENCHLHAFTIARKRYGTADEELGSADEGSVRLRDLPRRGTWSYEYDFGDSWEHAITVEGVEAARTDIAYPACIDGSGACPPEDCGGWPGYARLKEILADPGDPEHDDMREWLGLEGQATWDPHRFDLTATDAALRRRERAGVGR